MTRQKTRSIALSIGQSDETGFSPVQLMRTGVFRDGDVTLSTDDFRMMAQNFYANVTKHLLDGRPTLPINYYHERWEKAAGWILEVELREGDSELWIKPLWTPEAAEKIKNKEICFISAEFDPNYRDNENGAKYGVALLGAGLTNVPEIKGMQSLKLSEEKPMNKDQVIKFLSETDDATRAEIGDKIGLKSDNVELTSKNELIQKLSTEKDALARQTVELSEQLAKTKADVKILQDIQAHAEKTKAFDMLLLNGKACEAQRDAYMRGDMAEFAEKAAPIQLSGGRKSSPSQQGTASGDEGAVEQLHAKANEIIKASAGATDYFQAFRQAIADNQDLGRAAGYLA